MIRELTQKIEELSRGCPISHRRQLERGLLPKAAGREPPIGGAIGPLDPAAYDRRA
jgi:hypothetical protein